MPGFASSSAVVKAFTPRSFAFAAALAGSRSATPITLRKGNFASPSKYWLLMFPQPMIPMPNVGLPIFQGWIQDADLQL